MLPSEIQGMRSIGPESLQTMEPYFRAFQTRRVYPRRSMSSLFTGIHPRKFYHGVYKDCLILAKNCWSCGKRVSYLLLPPIHIQGDLWIEKSVMAELQGLGFSAKLSGEDLGLYGITTKEVRREDSMDEYLYLSGDMDTLPGPKFKDFRNNVSRARRLEKEGSLSFGSYGFLTPELISSCRVTAEAWDQHRKEKGRGGLVTYWYLDNFNAYVESNPGRLRCHTLKSDGKIVAYSITEQLTLGYGIIVSRYRDYAYKGVQDPSAVLHHMDGHYWSEVSGPATLLNMGNGASTPSLIAAKENLKPTKVLDFWHLKATSPMSDTDFRSIGSSEMKPQTSILDLFS